MVAELETESFGCTCGKDPNNKNQNAYKAAIKNIHKKKEKKKKRRKHNASHRIVGGESLKNPNPWFVFIRIQTTSSSKWLRCGGTLLNQRWALTAAFCFCSNQDDKRPCKREKGRLVVDYDLEMIDLWFGIQIDKIGLTNNDETVRMRGVKKVIIHEDYDIKDPNKLGDLALIKFDRSLKQKDWKWDSANRDQIYPICLPDFSYDEIKKKSFVTGWGAVSQDTCRTNGKGPEIYSTCAFGSFYTNSHGKTLNITKKTDGHKSKRPCLSGPVKVLDEECRDFNDKMNDKFEEADEIVLVPKDRSNSKLYRACYNMDTKFDKTDKIIEKSVGWCGTCNPTATKKDHGYCGEGAEDNEDNFARIKPSSGWGYCTEECRDGKSNANKQLSIADQDILPANDCRKLLRGIHSKKNFFDRKQLCVGYKITLKDPLFFQYEGKAPKIKFKPIKPLKDYKSSRGTYVRGLDYMIGGKDSCEGDSGGPLWTREATGEGGEFLAYLVGVVSARLDGEDCAKLNSPAFYTRVKHYVKWIKKHATGGDCNSKNKKNKKKSDELNGKKNQKSKAWKSVNMT